MTYTNNPVDATPDQLFLQNGYSVVEQYSSGHYLYAKSVEFEGGVFNVNATDHENPSGYWNFDVNNTDIFCEDPWTREGDKFSLRGPEGAMSLDEVELFYIQAYVENNKRVEELERVMKEERRLKELSS